MRQSIAALDALLVRASHSGAMASRKDPVGLPEAVKVAEARALKRLWDNRPPMSQARFATDVLGKSSGYLPQFFTGQRPIPLDYARLFAKYLGCQIADFSPRLAAEDQAARVTVRWPFSTISAAEIGELAPWLRAELEGVIRGFLLRKASDEPAPGGRRTPRTKSG